VGKVGALDKVLGTLKVGGAVGIYGLDDEGKVSINPSNAKGTFTVYNDGYDDSEMHRQVLDFVKQGKLDARIWFDMDHPYPLEKIAEAFEDLRQRKAVKALIQLHG
jgi:threonine dehydrogenase-like Zn-dependent dehydrogenase